MTIRHSDPSCAEEGSQKEMLSYYLPFVSMSAYAFADVIGNSSPSVILVSLGSLLFVLGTVLRRSLPAPDGTTSLYPCTARVDSMPLHRSIGTVDGVPNPAASQIHASAA
jgi:hypothetical protein